MRPGIPPPPRRQGVVWLPRAQRSRSLGSPVLDLVAEAPRDAEQGVEVEVDASPGLLRDLVLDGEVEIVGAVVERAERALVLRQHRRADVLHVVEEDARERDPAAVLLGRDLTAAERRPVRLVRPAQEREQPPPPLPEGAGGPPGVGAPARGLVRGEPPPP